MSHNLATVDVEARTSASAQRSPIVTPRPVLVRTPQSNPDDCATRRVIEVVEQQLANGSMPA